MFRYKLFCFFLIAGFVANAQDKTGGKVDFAFSSPAGNYILLNLDGKTFSPSTQVGYTIERSFQKDNKFSKLAGFNPVKTYEAFQQIVGEALAVEFKNYIKAKSNDEVIKFLNAAHPTKDYGLFILDIHFLQAMGLVYLDAIPEEKTAQYEYRIVNTSGKTIRQQAANSFIKNSLPRGQVKKIFTTDSLLSIRWNFAGDASGFPLFGQIYKQEDGTGKFVAVGGKTTINTGDKDAYAVYDEQATPEKLVNYFIVAEDIFGNQGYPSDTATAISINYKKIAGVQNITVKDTMDGLLSQWKALPAKPWYTGIQILRSRDARKDFIVLDSLSANATSYLDKQVLPNITYFYKFRVLVYKLSGWDEIIATTVHGSRGSSNTPPLAPKNFAADKEGENIRLSWDHNMELDLFAYYVLRGTSIKNMEIVSPAITDTTWVDSAANLSGRTNYVYSVLSMNNNQLKSAASETAGILPARGEFVEAPTGITIRPSGKKLVLTWPDISKNDVAVAGYILYRKKAMDATFAPVINALITKPYYEDAAVEPNTSYVYNVASADRFGYQSQPSPNATFTWREHIQPPAEIYVRKLSGGAEISWPNNADEKILTYNIYRKIPGDKDYTKLGSAKESDGLFIDKKVVLNKLNIYTVSITTQAGESGKCVEKTLFVGK